MFIEILIFLLFGTAVGLVVGFAPGLHPNTIILFIPLLLAISPNPSYILVFIVSMAVSNIIADFIPSLLFGAADSENALGIHPAQKMLMKGEGLAAIKLSMTGALGSVVFMLLLLPVLMFSMPNIYDITRPYIHLILILIVAFMMYNEKNKLLSLGCFLAAGLVGLLSFQLPVDNTLILFPILAGLFGMPAIILKLKHNLEIPEQKTEKEETMPLPRKLKSVVLGTFGGVASGFLPGVGTSEVAGMATVDKNSKSFLITLGAISMANILFSFITIFLIGKARSGVAVAASGIAQIGYSEMLLILSAAFVSITISILLVLFLSKRILDKISRINYISINKLVLASLIILVYVFAGFYGIFIAGLCTALGLIASFTGVKRGLLMGVLILPTILFFAGF